MHLIYDCRYVCGLTFSLQKVILTVEVISLLVLLIISVFFSCFGSFMNNVVESVS